MTNYSSVSEKALVLFSGGQDSTTCLAWALERFEEVETVGFDYGQRHSVELECRLSLLELFRAYFPNWTPGLGRDHLLELDIIGAIGETALTTDAKITIAKDGLPSTFVPGRNLLFLTLAGAVAYRRGIRHLVGGMCEADYSGYPDCRDDTLKAFQVALNLGMDRRFVLHTPLMWLDKAQGWELAHQLGGQRLTKVIVDETHTCYLGNRDEKQDWGYGCGTCPACELRARGYEKYFDVKSS